MKVCARCSELYTDDAAFCPSDGTALAKSDDPYLGRTLAARYQLVRRLGAGGMSLVYLARHVVIERACAIKILRRELSMSPTHRERFLREARAVNRINHPNIVEITDFGENDGLVYLVMEYVAGDSLLKHVRRGRFGWPRAAKVAIEVAAALARAHQSNVVHRDLKPENVILVPNGDAESVKLIDFGIAKVIDAPALTLSQQLFGTPGYIAPEYVEGTAADGRADLYSLGVMIYEMLSGALPHDARTQADHLVMPLTSAPTPLSAKVAGVPADLESLVLRMLARRREDRPRDASEVVDALSDVLRRFGPNGSRRPPPISDGPPSDGGSRPTLVEPPPGERASEGRITADVERLPTMAIASRWRGALSEIDEAIARASDAPAKRRASALAEAARDMVGSVERASSRVAELQSRVDRIEARARATRGNLGHAIDELLRERARERAHVAALRGRRASLGDDARRRGDLDGDAEVWESAALLSEEERVASVDRDLSFQIDALQRTLDRENEQLESELAAASGALEGSLSALRVLTADLVKTLDEAATAASAHAVYG